MKKLIALLFMLVATLAWAQTETPQPYKPIPNYTGVGAGQKLLDDINGKLAGPDVVQPALVKLYFAHLPAEKNGQMYYVIDGMPGSSPCTGGGGGAIATGISGQWSCSGGGGGGGAMPVPCIGNIPLVSGVGAYTASCVGTASYCSCRDTTNPAFTCYTGNPVTGSVAVTGNGNDNAQVMCSTTSPTYPSVTNYVGPVNIAGNSANGTDVISGVNGVLPNALNMQAFGYKTDARSDITCAINNLGGSPGTVTGCTVLALTSADVGHPFRAVWPGSPYGANVSGSGTGNLTPCIASVTDVASFVYGVITHWTPSSVIATGKTIEDSNGNTETATTGGTTGTSKWGPTWPVTQGTTTTDGSVLWTLTSLGSTGACQQAPYPGTSQTGVYVQTGTDDLWPIMRAVLSVGPVGSNAVYPIKLFFSSGVGMITDTIELRGRSGEIGGIGSFQSSALATLVWDGPRGHPAMRVHGDTGLWVHDFYFIPNSSSNNRWSACVDTLQDTQLNAFDRIERINCNPDYGPQPDWGYVNNLPTLKYGTYGLEFDPDSTGQNDRLQINQLSTGRDETCFFVGQQQIDTDVIMDSTCTAGSNTCFVDDAGGQITFRDNSCLGNGLSYSFGGGVRVFIDMPTYQAGPAWQGEQIPFSLQLLRFDSGATVGMNGQAPVSGSHTPDNGVTIDTAGRGILPVYPGNSATVVANQVVQLAPNWPDWEPSLGAALPSFEAWWPSSPFGSRTIILPVNNNPNLDYFIVNPIPSSASPIGITGLTEPNWNSICPTIGMNCTDSQTGHAGITWTNYGPIPPQYVVVPSVGNPGRFAFLLTGSGTTGTAPPIWPQAVGSPIVDGTANWLNIGVLPTNPGLFAFRASAACTTGSTPPTAFSQALNGTTSDGGCSWVTTYGGVFTNGIWQGTNATTTNVLDMANAGIAQGSGGTGDAASVAETYIDMTPINGNSSLPHTALYAGSQYGFGKPGVLRIRTGLDNSGTSNRQNQIIYRRGTYGASAAGEVTEETIPGNSQVFQTYRRDLNGKVNVNGGPLALNQLPAPTTPASGTCMVPAWVASTPVFNRWVIKPTAGNAGAYFFQNQTGATFTTGTTQPATWNQTVGGTTSDNGNLWTNVGSGASGSPGVGAAGLYRVKTTWRAGTGALPGETTASPEATVACGPTDSQVPSATTGVPTTYGVAITFTNYVVQGPDSIGVYATTGAANAEALSVITPLDTFGGNGNTGGSFNLPVARIVPPPWVVSTVHAINDVMKPVNNNAGGFTYVEVNPYCRSSTTTEPTWSQVIAAATTDGECSWVNIGLGTPPTVNSTTPLQWGIPDVALGGGAAPTLGTIGGSGPATAAQNSWLQLKDSTGANVWVPIWK